MKFFEPNKRENKHFYNLKAREDLNNIKSK